MVYKIHKLHQIGGHAACFFVGKTNAEIGFDHFLKTPDVMGSGKGK